MAKAKAKRTPGTAHLDPVIMTVIANRLDGIVREMTNTLLRAARSAVISSARDFSCCIITGDNQLLASAEGLPVHIFGAHLQGENMCKYHAGDIREGDAYLDNDPYGGNTHPADHTILVPVFIAGENALLAASTGAAIEPVNGHAFRGRFFKRSQAGDFGRKYRHVVF